MSQTGNTSLANSQYQFVIENFKTHRFYAQGVNLPGVAMSTIENFPNETEYSVGSHRLAYSPFQMRFIVDENMDNYVEIYDWMKEVSQTDDAHLSLFTNAVLIVYNRQYQSIREIHFKDCVCTSLADLDFETINDESVMVATATFEFSEYEFSKP